MKVTQIYELINTVTEEITGKTGLVMEDLSNVVDIGVAILDATSVENYVRSLVDHIGKMVFVDRRYQGGVPSVLMDGWEYGAVLQKVSLAELPKAQENDTWNLQDGESYDVNVFYQAQVKNKFYSNRVTFEIPMSFCDKQLKSAFDNATQLNAFISMIYTGIENSLTVKIESLIMRTINNMTALAIAGAAPMQAINLLAAYNAQFGTTLKAENAITTPEFLRWASYQMGLTKTRMSKMSTLFNGEGNERFTPEDRLHFVGLAEFVKGADVYLQSDVFHNDLTKLPNGIETVPYWQGSGTAYDFASTSKINVTPAGGTEAVEKGGILAVMFDRDALGVANLDRRVTSHYNGHAEFYNNWYKFDAGYFCDRGENFVVFYIEDEEAGGGDE